MLAALSAASRGWYVFPIKAGDKTPLLPWRSQSSRDQMLIRRWAAQLPGCNWGVDCGKSNLVVLDVDNKNGVRGADSLATLSPPPLTLNVVTPNNGKHYYFTGRNPSKRGFLPGLDLKADGGYVVLFGGTLPNGDYILAEDVPAAPAPDWLLTAAGRTRIKRDPFRGEAWLTEPDKTEYIEWAINWLENEAPECIEGQNGDDTLVHRVLFLLRDNGISQDKAVELVMQHYNDAKCFPPWTDAELQLKARNAYQYAALPPATATPEAQLASAVAAFAAEPLLGRIRPSSVATINAADLPPRRWIVKHRLLRGYATGLIAPGGVGKSTYTFLDALAVATGRDLTGDAVVETGPVVLYNAEDPLVELQMRFAAVAMHYNVDLRRLKHPVYLVSGRDHELSVATYNDHTHSYKINENAVADLSALVQETGAILFVGDPFVHLHDVPENDNKAIAKVTKMFSDLAGRLQIAMHLVHHTRKMGATGGEGDAETARGAKSFTDVLRLVHTLSVMSEEDATRYGIAAELRRWYVRLDDAKLNLAAPADKVRWFKRISVQLPNGEQIGTLERIEKLEPVPKVKQTSAIMDLQAATRVIPFDFPVELAEVVRRMQQQNPADERTAQTIYSAMKRKFETTEAVQMGNVELRLQKPGSFGLRKGYHLTMIALDGTVVPAADPEAELFG